MRKPYIAFLLLFCQWGKAQVIDVYPEDECAEHVSYGAFLPANINNDQDNQTKKNLEKYHLEFKVEKESYVSGETVKVVLTNKAQVPVELTVEPARKTKCKSSSDDLVWTGAQGEISLVRISFFGEGKGLDPGESIQFDLHIKTGGRYKFGLLVGNDATFGDAGLIVTSAFEVIAQ